MGFILNYYKKKFLNDSIYELKYRLKTLKKRNKKLRRKQKW